VGEDWALMDILVLNPGGNRLRIDILACGPNQRHAFEANKLLSVIIDWERPNIVTVGGQEKDS
jgi:hypothetical protein